MTKNEIKEDVIRRLSQGEGKTAVFRTLSGKGLSDRVLAHFIASYADPKLCDQHAKLIDAMIVISWLELALGVLVSIGLGLTMGLIGLLVLTGFVGGFCYLFVWGFTRNKAWAYNVSILMSLVNAPKALNGFAESPVASLVALGIGVGLFMFTWHVRGKLFPDFAFIGPKKEKGMYVFSS
jgi:hypothetical protein